MSEENKKRELTDEELEKASGGIRLARTNEAPADGGRRRVEPKPTPEVDGSEPLDDPPHGGLTP